MFSLHRYMDTEVVTLTVNYLDILYTYRRHGEENACRQLQEMCSKNKEDNYLDKLLHASIQHLLLQLKSKRGWDMQADIQDRSLQVMSEALKDYGTTISVIGLIAKDADLSATDDFGKMPVDHLLQMLIGNELDYDRDFHVIERLDISVEVDMHLEDELMLKLLYSLMNEKVLNSPYRWGYSHFSVFVMLGWWKLVEWGLDSGADVSDNGVCPYIPMDAVFAGRDFVYEEDEVLFARLIHPSSVNHRIAPGSDPEVPFEKLPVPLHNIATLGNIDFYTHLLNAGACIDLRNQKDELPLDIFVNTFTKIHSYIFKIPASIKELNVLSRLIPRSVGLSPMLFLQLLLSWDKFYPSENFKNIFLSIFCQHLMLSSGWQKLCVVEVFFSPYNRGCLMLCVGGNDLDDCRTVDLRGFEFIIHILAKCGIRARHMPAFPHLSNTFIDSNAHRCDEIKDKWNQYRTSTLSLRLQCVRVIRSALKIVTKERLQTLPIPKCVQEDIYLESVVEEIHNEFYDRSQQ